MVYTVVERGSPYSFDFKVYFANENGFISPFHDIPLFANKEKTILNMIVEVPRWSNAKMEISKDEPLNPIKQDIKKNKLRFVDNCFPHHGFMWNYGAFPQTWEDPNVADEHTGLVGDNDPIDVCEIGYKIRNRGDVVRVKVLGILALIDEGETDWKVLAIDVEDPLAKDLNDIEDIETKMPGFLLKTNEWFRIYKIPTGKPENQFAFNGEPKNKEFADSIIQAAHEQWKGLVMSDTSPVFQTNTTVKGSPFVISLDQAKAIVDAAPARGEPAEIPPEVQRWHYVKL